MDLSTTAKTYDGLRDLIVKEQFANSVNKDLSIFLRERGPEDLKELAKLADQFLIAHNQQLCVTRKEDATPSKKDKKDVTCYNCGKQGHKSFDCWMEIPKKPGKCYECGVVGHKAAECGQKKANAKKPVERPKIASKRTQLNGTKDHGGEKHNEEIDKNSKRSCAKIVLVKIYLKGKPEDSLKAYAILDDQSNKTLAKPELFNHFNINEPKIEYSITSCTGSIISSGRTSNSLVVESFDGKTNYELPQVIECCNIPGNKEEIPTPEIGLNFSHLKDISSKLYELQSDAEIQLLIGRDLIDAHQVCEQIIGNPKTPFAQRLSLGWVIVGELCLGNSHVNDELNVKRTYILQDGRHSICPPCPYNLKIETADDRENIGADVFKRDKHDNSIGLSIEDKKFLDMMSRDMKRNEAGNWTAPLPFKDKYKEMNFRSNRESVLRRTRSMVEGLKYNLEKQEHFLRFMEELFKNGHAERAPASERKKWYLPLFGVYHPKKPNKIRVVFDSSAKEEGISLNEMMMTGPDLTNSLLGILLRFRKYEVAVVADIQQMFYCFYVDENDRDFLRFFWHDNNDPRRELVEYRMCVHVFGNGPSPAIATYGLRKAALETVDEYGEDVCTFVNKNFYVDDGIVSTRSPEETVSLIKRTQSALEKGGNLRLHKIMSNYREVLKCFQPSDLALGNVALGESKMDFGDQRVLGITWNVEEDCFQFSVSQEIKPLTKRGLLSVVNGVYDPIGFAAPVLLQGRLFLQDLRGGWDDLLSPEVCKSYCKWRDSLVHLEEIRVPRPYMSGVSGNVEHEVHIFSDASKDAIGAVAYLRTKDLAYGKVHISYIMGKSKVAPKHGHTIPRLELCAAVLAVEIGEFTQEHLDLQIKKFKYHTDSQVVLGYITNETRRFFVYVENRVSRIRSKTQPEQWCYVATDSNPADQATRPLSATKLQNSMWLNGPEFLLNDLECDTVTFPLIDPNEDREIRQEIIVDKLESKVQVMKPLVERFTKFSTWSSLVRALKVLKTSARKKSDIGCEDVTIREVEDFIIGIVQKREFDADIEQIQQKGCVKSSSSIVKLDPYIEDGLLRVGGRIRNSHMSHEEKMPIIIPKRSYVANLLVKHFHEKVYHQGRHFTEGEIRKHGYWVIGVKKIVTSILKSCVTCRRVRYPCETQKMGNLPEERLTSNPPFTYVGVDMFGPFHVVTRKTRGGAANNKRWVAMFTCLSSRAVHMEVVEEMSSSSFINALRRFVAIRGPVKLFRSDRGTNFVASCKELQMNAINVEDKVMINHLEAEGTCWKFNPPHSSHMGGVWERMIGITRKIVNCILTDNKYKRLTHEVLCTLMYEISAIINGRPLVPVSSDVDQPLILSPSMLLNYKQNTGEKSFENLTLSEIYKSQWKFVQKMAETFWTRWRKEYLQTLQSRTKWFTKRRNIKVNDIVLMKENCERNVWPMGIVTKVFPSGDGLVRKVQVRVYREEKCHLYTRPVTDIVLLVESEIL
jgi:hypothetical protein